MNLTPILNRLILGTSALIEDRSMSAVGLLADLDDARAAVKKATRLPTTKLTNEIVLYAASMGTIFRVTHICPDMEDANRIMAQDRDTTCIAEDNNGFVYLAEAYGFIAPSSILKNLTKAKA